MANLIEGFPAPMRVHPIHPELLGTLVKMTRLLRKASQF